MLSTTEMSNTTRRSCRLLHVTDQSPVSVHINVAFGAVFLLSLSLCSASHCPIAIDCGKTYYKPGPSLALAADARAGGEYLEHFLQINLIVGFSIGALSNCVGRPYQPPATCYWYIFLIHVTFM